MTGPLQPVKHGSLKEQVRDKIREAIFRSQYEPGDALREAHLANELQVSQSTVREALVELEHVGLVVRVPNKGTTVTKFTREEMLERLDIRVRLEEMAWLEAAVHMKPEHFERLRRHLKIFTEAIEKNNHFESAQADLQFHRYLWRQCGNDTLCRMLNQLTVPLFAFISIKRKSGQQNLKEVVPSHEDVVQSIQTNDPEKIKAALRRHFEEIRSMSESAL